MCVRIQRSVTGRCGLAATSERSRPAARVRAIVKGSDRLKAVVGLNQAITAFDKATIPPRLVKRYNDAVLRYERNRDGTLRNIVATLDGYEAHPTLQLTSP